MDNCRALRCKHCVSARASIFGGHLPTDDVTCMRRLLMTMQCARATLALCPGVHMASVLEVVLATFVARVKGVMFYDLCLELVGETVYL